MTDSDSPDYFPLIFAQWEPDDVARHIAKVLLDGKPSPMFLTHLAHMFDRPQKTIVAFRADVKRFARNRPRKGHNEQLGRAMIDAMSAKAPDEKSADIAARIGREFRVTARTAYATWERQKEMDAAWAALQKSR